MIFRMDADYKIIIQFQIGLEIVLFSKFENLCVLPS